MEALFGRQVVWVFAVVVLAGSAAPDVRAQAQRKGARPTATEGAPVVEESSEVANLFRNAQDAVDRADWKLAIDSLSRVIADPAGLRQSGVDAMLYVSPRRYAYEMLASLPEEGLDAYHVHNDGRARGLLEQARRDRDLDALRLICDRYLLTASGVESAKLLASWLLDLGGEAEALAVLEEALIVHPDGGGSLPEIELLKAIALELQGDDTGAAGALARAREAKGGTSGGVADAVESFVSGSRGGALSASSRSSGDWTGPGGGGACTGMMEAVVPSVAEHLPWRRPIPSVIPGVWPDLDALRPDLLPVTQPVVVDGRVFVKAGRECTAIDLQSFGVLWTAERSVEGIAERARTQTGAGTSEQQLLSDYVVGSLTSAHGLVFSVERGDAGVDFAADGVVVIQGVVARQSSKPTDTSNRLVAYDALTGERRWQRGRGGDPDERLQRAQFLAPAVGVGEDLWVAFAYSGDLYVGVLDPTTGNMVRRIFLCALSGRSVDGAAALFCAHADGTVYVPTGHGLLFAIDAGRRTIRWASRYRIPPVQRGRRGFRPVAPASPEWLSGPPVIVGGTVILAPSDDERLLAFDRLTGSLMWELPRDRHRYVIAADRDSVWVGGEDISHVSIRDRAYTWRAPVPGATARAVMCGEMIYVPDRSSLRAIDRATGDIAETYELPADQTPFGNLVCSAGSLISLDTSELRAFPDRDSYADTLAAHGADPTDVSMAIRLAYMELLNREPHRALDALKEVRFGDSPDAESHRVYASHLQVEALKQLGNAPDTASEAAVSYLHQAVAAAIGRRDRIAAHMALGRKLRRIGRFKEAYGALFSLGRSITADDTIDADSSPVELNARTAVGEVLGRIEPELGTSERRALSEEVGAFFSDALARLASPETRTAARHELPALADCRVLDGWDQAALNALGRLETERGKPERAEQHLLESVRRASDRTRTAEALLALLDLYLGRSQSLARSATEIADRLDREFGDVEVGAVKVATLSADRRRGIDSSIAAGHGRAVAPAPFTIVPRLAYPKPPQEDLLGLVGFRGERLESQSERVLCFAPPRTLRSYVVETGEIEWESELLLHGDFAYGGAQPQINTGGGVRFEQRTALVDGQTAIINSRRGIHAVGVMTGLRLWAEPFEGGSFFGDPALRNDSTDVGDGRIAYLSAPRMLTVRRLVDGRLIWKRNMRSESVGAVRIRDDFVLTADPNLEAVHVFSVSNGEQLCKLKFSQPDDDDGIVVPISYSDGVLCGPSDHAVIGYNARTGTRLWSLPLPADPTALFEPVEGRLVVGVAGGYHWLIDTRSGDIIFEQQYDSLVGGAKLGVLESGVLVMSGVEDTTEGDLWHLVGVDTDPERAGDVLWERDLLGLTPGPQMRIADGVIPMVALLPDETTLSDSDGRVQHSIHYRQAVVVIDKRSGADVGEPLYPDTFSERLTGEMAVWPGRLVLQTTKNVMTLSTVPASARPTGASGGVN